MNVYYIGNRYDGCYYVRCYLPMLHNGWNGTKRSLRAPYANPQQMLKGAMQSDIVVFQRPDDEKKLEAMKLLKQAGKKVVFDNDDTYKPDSGVPTCMNVHDKGKLEEMNSILMKCVAEADLVTTTTQFLAKEYRKYNDNVVVLPNMVDTDDWEVQKNDTDKVRIGLVGSVLSNKDYECLIPALDKLNTMDNVQLVILGLPADKPNLQLSREIYKEEIEFWNKYNVEWHHFVPQYEYNELLGDLKLDIMLIPRQNSYFNKCKSNLKYLEASMLEIPVVASGFKYSPYEDIKGLLVEEGDDWFPAIDMLVKDKDMREHIGRTAKRHVLKHYDINKWSHLWVGAYQSMYENN